MRSLSELLKDRERLEVFLMSLRDFGDEVPPFFLAKFFGEDGVIDRFCRSEPISKYTNCQNKKELTKAQTAKMEKWLEKSRLKLEKTEERLNNILELVKECQTQM